MFKGELVTVAAILGLVIIEVVALLNGVNGTLLAAIVAVVAGLGGYNAKPLLEKVGLVVAETKKK